MRFIMVLLSVISAVGSFNSCTGIKDVPAIIWKEYPSLPPADGAAIQYGLASPFAGMTNGVVIVAGGSNFPDKPLAEGGVKHFHDDVFVLVEKDGAPEWLSGFRLEKPVAGGASVSLEIGLLCIGGSGYEGMYRDVFLMKWDEKKQVPEIKNFPSLPFPMTNMGATLVENTVYVAGGLTGDGESNKFLKLDLSKQESPEFNWEILSDFPGDGRQQPLLIAQNTTDGISLFLFSGSVYPKEYEHPVIHTNGLKYDLQRQTWQYLSEILSEPNSEPYSLYGASGLKSGERDILFMGGADRDIMFDAITRERDAQTTLQLGDTSSYQEFLSWKQSYLTQPAEYYRLNTDVLAYHTPTDKWKVIAKIPFPAFVCAAAVEWKKGWLLINGEIKPGIRTPKVYYGELTSELKCFFNHD